MKPLVIQTFRDIERQDGTHTMLMTWYYRKRFKKTVLAAYATYCTVVATYNYRYRNEE